MDTNSLPLVLKPSDVAKALNISKNKAYEHMHKTGFPCFKVGKQYRIYRESFLHWLENAHVNAA